MDELFDRGTVALKKVALRRLEDGIPNQALREIKALQEIEDNQNVVKLKDVFPHGTGFVLVFDFMLSDLSEVVPSSELLYGARKYDEGVDGGEKNYSKAVGCIFGELLKLVPLFPGENDIEQLCCVLRVLGTPTQDSWPEIVNCQYNKITFRESSDPIGGDRPDHVSSGRRPCSTSSWFIRPNSAAPPDR
ncbi:Cyclin-dependent kinase 20 [Larimichthys crocea]|uniref:cyclin-dependent kinase n=1 Tax=Larimichthys crocea TaxID=215358 RepID=A0A6G0HCX2_LARCR|nr:Cyclin-dependent kinase 20 [Larimichthys crocea]